MPIEAIESTYTRRVVPKYHAALVKIEFRISAEWEKWFLVKALNHGEFVNQGEHIMKTTRRRKLDPYTARYRVTSICKYICKYARDFSVPKYVRNIDDTKPPEKKKMRMTKPLEKICCEANIVRKTMGDGRIVVHYYWKHAPHDPLSIDRIDGVRRRSKITKWIYEKYSGLGDWKMMGVPLALPNRLLDQVSRISILLTSSERNNTNGIMTDNARANDKIKIATTS
jgi:hypothetical protein